MLSLTVTNKWNINQLDANNAFLNGLLSEDVFMPTVVKALWIKLTLQPCANYIVTYMGFVKLLEHGTNALNTLSVIGVLSIPKWTYLFMFKTPR